MRSSKLLYAFTVLSIILLSSNCGAKNDQHSKQGEKVMEEQENTLTAFPTVQAKNLEGNPVTISARISNVGLVAADSFNLAFMEVGVDSQQMVFAESPFISELAEDSAQIFTATWSAQGKNKPVQIAVKADPL